MVWLALNDGFSDDELLKNLSLKDNFMNDGSLNDRTLKNGFVNDGTPNDDGLALNDSTLSDDLAVKLDNLWLRIIV